MINILCKKKGISAVTIPTLFMDAIKSVYNMVSVKKFRTKSITSFKNNEIKEELIWKIMYFN